MALVTEGRRASRIAIRRLRAVFGVPDAQEAAVPAWLSAAIVFILLAACWAAGIAVGGAAIVPPHWFYLPIGIAAARFRVPGALAAGLAAGMLAGPFLPLDTDLRLAQPFSDWGARTLFFIAFGSLAGWLVDLYRDALEEMRSSKAVARALMGTLEDPADDASRRAGRKRIVAAAARRDTLQMVLQPIVRIDTREPVGYEALARFRMDPQRPPNEWFTEAWSLGLGVHLEIAALRSALSLLPRIPSGYLSVNLSPATMLSPLFRQAISSLPPDRLVLELTEHVPVSEYGPLADAIADLRDRGIRIAVDDAGAGYASLRHLIRLEPDVIKLDITLVRGIDENPLLRTIASALIGFGNESGAAVVAEGIETTGELEALREAGASYGQGFLFARPQPLESFGFTGLPAAS